MTDEEILKHFHLDWLISPSELVLYHEQKAELGPHLEIARKLHDLAQKAFGSIEFRSDHEVSLAIGALFLRIMNSHKAVMREASFGYWAEAETMGRSIFEALVYMAEMMRDPTFLKEYFKRQNQLVMNLANAYLRDEKREQPVLKRPNFEGFDPKVLRENAIADLPAEGIEAIAERNDLTVFAEQNYKLLHSSVHVKPSSIRRHFEDFGKIAQLPRPQFAANIVAQFNIAFAEAIKRLGIHFKITGLEAESEEVADLLANLIQKLPTTARGEG